MTSNNLQSSLTKMISIINKHQIKDNIPISQLSITEQAIDLLSVCKELGIDKDIVLHLIIYEDRDENIKNIIINYLEKENHKDYDINIQKKSEKYSFTIIDQKTH